MSTIFRNTRAGFGGAVIALLFWFGGERILAYPVIEPGFPVQAWHGGGSYHGGPAIHTLVAEIDGDPELEIIVTGLSTGPLYAWNHDGTIVAGWPVSTSSGAGYMAAGYLTNPGAARGNILEIFSGHWGTPGALIALASDGTTLPGWPQNSANFVSTPPALADIDGDGLDEIFIGEEDWDLHAYHADGSVVTGWPADGGVGQEMHTPAVADLDGDGDLEILSVSGSTSAGVTLHVYHHDGSTVAGFPFVFDNGHVDTFPVVGDVDGDGEPEIVVVSRMDSYPWSVMVYVLSAAGNVDCIMTASDTVPYGTAPALGDLDGDGMPEIVVQIEGAIAAWNGDGTAVPGWPVTWTGYDWLGNSSPVIGDIDGDNEPEIVVTAQVGGSGTNGQVRAYNADGSLVTGFPINLPIGSGAVPAIADIDRDGRNEVIVTGSYWDGYSGNYDKVWAYDLGNGPHGRIEWGQFGGGPRNQNVYQPECVGDLDGDGDVDLSDLAELLAHYNNGPGGDLDHDGDTDLADLALLLSRYGDVCW